MTDVERLAAICSAPYRNEFGVPRCPHCTAPTMPPRWRTSGRIWGDVPESECRCGGAA